MKHLTRSRHQSQVMSLFYMTMGIILFGFISLIGQFTNHGYADFAIASGTLGTFLGIAAFYRIDAWAYDLEEKMKGEQKLGFPQRP